MRAQRIKRIWKQKLASDSFDAWWCGFWWRCLWIATAPLFHCAHVIYTCIYYFFHFQFHLKCTQMLSTLRIWTRFGSSVKCCFNGAPLLLSDHFIHRQSDKHIKHFRFGWLRVARLLFDGVEQMIWVLSFWLLSKPIMYELL